MKCPWCAEEIADEARKCKHCGEFLERTAVPSNTQQTDVCAQCGHVSETSRAAYLHDLNEHQHAAPSGGSRPTKQARKPGKCRICGAEFPGSVPSSHTKNEHPEAFKLQIKVVAGIFVVVAGLWAAVALTGGHSSSSSSSHGSSTVNAADRKVDAFETCKDFVKRRLKSPSTATFRNYFQNDGEVDVTGSGDGPYAVISSVDAENSFGAKLRQNFSCTVSLSGDKWHLDDLSIDQ